MNTQLHRALTLAANLFVGATVCGIPNQAFAAPTPFVKCFLGASDLCVPVNTGTHQERPASFSETYNWLVTFNNIASGTAQYGHLRASTTISGCLASCGFSTWTHAQFFDNCTIVGGIGDASVRFHFSFVQATGNVWVEARVGNQACTNAGPGPASCAATPSNGGWTAAYPFTFGSPFELTVTLKAYQALPATPCVEPYPSATSSAEVFLDAIEITGGSGAPCGSRMIGETCTAYVGAPLPPVLYVDPAAQACGDGSTWNSALNDLQYALQLGRLAQTAHSGFPSCPTEIWVKGGTYKPDTMLGLSTTSDSRAASFVVTPDVPLRGGFGGAESNPSQRNLSDASHRTTLSGDLMGDDTPNFGNRGDNCRHVVYSGREDRFIGHRVTLDALTIRGGRSDPFDYYTPAIGGGGGGVFLRAISATLADCVIEENESQDDGGGLRLDIGTTYPFPGETHDLVLTRCRITGNRATNAGGGVRVGDYNFYSGLGSGGGHDYLTATDCTFESNSAGVSGGAVYLTSFSAGGLIHTLDACQFTLNSAGSGGAIGAGGAAQCSGLAVQGSYGGGVNSDGWLSLTRSQITDTTNGTGVRGNPAFLESCVIANTQRTIVMTLYAADVRAGALSNCLISGNGTSANRLSDVLRLYDSTCSHTTLVNNFGSRIISRTGTTAIDNCVIWNNGSTFSSGIQATYMHNSVVQSSPSALISNPTPETISNADPMFINDLSPAGLDARWGTCDDGLRLLPGSPAIERGAGLYIAPDRFDLDHDFDVAEPVPFDLAGTLRVQGALPDAGAYEFGTTGPSVGAPGGSTSACPTGGISLTSSPSGGSPFSYQWQFAVGAGPWTLLAEGVTPVLGGTLTTSGASTATIQLGVALPPSIGSLRFRTLVANLCGSITSSESVVAILPDLNSDGFVNTADLAVLLLRFGQSTPQGSPGAIADLNADSVVNTADLTLLLLRFGQSCP